MNCPQEIACGLVAASCNGTVLFEPGKKVLNQLTCLVQILVTTALVFARVAQGRVVGLLLQAGKVVVIEPLRTRQDQRSHDRHLYKMRHLIDNFFAWLKQYRAIATRYDKTACNFLGAIHLAGAVVWLNW